MLHVRRVLRLHRCGGGGGGFERVVVGVADVGFHALTFILELCYANFEPDVSGFEEAEEVEEDAYPCRDLYIPIPFHSAPIAHK